MSCVNNSSDINQTFIIELQSTTVSACTDIYTNVVVSCTGDTQIILDTGVILFDGSLYTNQDLTANTVNANYYFSGGTELQTIINYKAISGGTFDSTLGNLSLITYDNTEILVTGFTNYYTTGATLIDSTVYFDRNDALSAYTLDLSTLDINDTFVTGGTPDNVTRSYIFTNNSGGTFTVAALTDIVTTGGTFYSSTHEIIFTNNTGGTFTVTGITDYFTTGATLIDSTVYFDRNDALSAYTLDLSSLDINDTFITGVTFNNNNLVLTNNSGGTISTLIDNFSGLTVNGNLTVTGSSILNTISVNALTANTFSVNTLSANTISATTYLNLPIDVRVTGGTYSSGTTIFTNNTGGTFNVTGYDSTDTYVTGFTYLNNKFTIKQNLGELDLDVIVNDFSGLTINGNLNITGNTTSNTISATTYLNLPIDVRVTGGTFNNSTDTITFTNNTGGTFLITGITDYYTTGATLIGSTAYFNRNDTLSAYTLNLSSLDVNDTFITGSTFNNNNLVLTNNSGGTITTLIDNFSGLTVNGNLNTNTISATTYLNLPIDVRVTGGTYSDGTASFKNNTGGTFNVTGFTTTDAFVTGFTYNDNNFTIKQNQGLSDLNILVNTMTGLTINGDFNVTGNSILNNVFISNLSATTHPLYLTASTVQGQLDDSENSFIRSEKIDKVSFKVQYQTGLVRPDIDSAIVTNSANTITIAPVSTVLFVNEIIPDTPINKVETFIRNFSAITFTLSDINTPTTANTRSIWYLGIDKVGTPVYRNSRVYDQDVCYLIRVLLENTAGVYTTILTKYYPDLAYNNPLDRGRRVLSSGILGWSGSASISFRNQDFTLTKDSVNYSNSKLDPNYLVVPDSSGVTPTSFLFILPNVKDVAVPLTATTTINPKIWYTSGGTIGGNNVGNASYQVYNVLESVTGNILIQTLASTSPAPQFGVNAIFTNRDDALAGLNSVVWPTVLPAGDTQQIGTFYLRAGMNPNGATMNDPTDFYFNPISNSNSSSIVGVTEHDLLSGKNSNPTYQHVELSAITYWNQIVQQTITDGITDSSPSQNAVFDVLALKANDISVVHKSGDTMTGNLTSPRFITIGGTSSQFVKGDGTLDSNVYLTGITSVITGSGVSNQVTFWNGTNSITGSTNFIWDNTNKRLGINGTPSFQLDVYGLLTGVIVDNVIRASSSASTAAITINNIKEDNTGAAQLVFQKKGIITWGFGVDYSQTGSKDFFIYDNTIGNNPFYISNTGEVRIGSSGTLNSGGAYNTQKMTIKTNGAVLINTTNDNGTDKLQIAGSALVNGLTYSAAIEITGTELNSLLTAGFYSGNNLGHAPTTDYYYISIEKHSVGNYAHQTATNFFLNKIYSRVSDNGVWQPWVELITTGNGGITGTGTTGQVTFWNGTNSIIGDTGFTWNNTTKKLGINGTPNYSLEVFGLLTGPIVDSVIRANSQSDYMNITVNATKAGGTGQPSFVFQKNGIDIWSFGSDYNATNTKNFFIYDATSKSNPLFITDTGEIRLGSAGTLGTGGFFNSQKLTIKTTGAVLINTVTDNSIDKLQVAGTAISSAWKTSGGTSSQYVKGDGTLGAISGISSGTDVFVTGGTLDNNSGIATFINNTGGTFTVTGFTGSSSSSSGIIRDQFIYTGGPQTFTTSQNIFSIVSIEVQGGGSLYSTQYSATTTTFTVLDVLNLNDYVVAIYNINNPISGGFPIDNFIVDGVTTRTASQNAIYDAIPWSSSTNTITNKVGYNALEFSGTGSFTSSVKVGDDSNTPTAAMVGSIRYREDANNSYLDMVMKTDVAVYKWVNVLTNTWV